MLTRSVRRALGAATAGLAVLAPVTLLATSAEARPTYGPSRPFVDVLNGQFKFTPLPDAAKIVRAKHGYIYKAGQLNSPLLLHGDPAGRRASSGPASGEHRLCR